MMYGIVMFADDSNMHSMEFFEEIQNVKWFGAVSVGVLAVSGNSDQSSSTIIEKEQGDESQPMPVQGPACNSSNDLVGWHTFNSLPYAGKSATYIDDRATMLPRKLEWAGFVMNSRLLWKESEDKPEWVNDLDLLEGVKDLESPLSLLKDHSMVEPLGRCRRQVLIWWLQVEARADSKFPPGLGCIHMDKKWLKFSRLMHQSHYMSFGPYCWRVCVGKILVSKVPLICPIRDLQIVEDARGISIDWPSKYIIRY